MYALGWTFGVPVAQNDRNNTTLGISTVIYSFPPFNFVLRTEIDDVAHLVDGAAIVAPEDFSPAPAMLRRWQRTIAFV